MERPDISYVYGELIEEYGSLYPNSPIINECYSNFQNLYKRDDILYKLLDKIIDNENYSISSLLENCYKNQISDDNFIRTTNGIMNALKRYPINRHFILCLLINNTNRDNVLNHLYNLLSENKITSDHPIETKVEIPPPYNIGDMSCPSVHYNFTPIEVKTEIPNVSVQLQVMDPTLNISAQLQVMGHEEPTAIPELNTIEVQPQVSNVQVEEIPPNIFEVQPQIHPEIGPEVQVEDQRKKYRNILRSFDKLFHPDKYKIPGEFNLQI